MKSIAHMSPESAAAWYAFCDAHPLAALCFVGVLVVMIGAAVASITRS